MNYLSKNELENSPIVANNRMNRERQAVGVNSYQKELGIDLVEWLINRLEKTEKVRWLDQCCGNGNALIQATDLIHQRGVGEKVELIGIDLVGMFTPFDQNKYPNLSLIETSLFDWNPLEEFDLITCIHGIHYLGDKLLMLSKTANWLAEAGLFLGSLDFENIRNKENRTLKPWLRNQWKEMNWAYHTRSHLLEIKGKTTWPIYWEYLGASDQAGPNYSGQEAVNSFYKVKI